MSTTCAALSFSSCEGVVIDALVCPRWLGFGNSDTACVLSILSPIVLDVYSMLMSFLPILGFVWGSCLLVSCVELLMGLLLICVSLNCGVLIMVSCPSFAPLSACVFLGKWCKVMFMFLSSKMCFQQNTAHA